MEILGFSSAFSVGMFFGRIIHINFLPRMNMEPLFWGSCFASIIPGLKIIQLITQNVKINELIISDNLKVLEFKNNSKLFNNFMIIGGLLGFGVGLLRSKQDTIE